MAFGQIIVKRRFINQVLDTGRAVSVQNKGICRFCGNINQSHDVFIIQVTVLWLVHPKIKRILMKFKIFTEFNFIVFQMYVYIMYKITFYCPSSEYRFKK